MVTTIKETATGNNEVLSWKNMKEATSYIMRNKRSKITVRPYEDRDAIKVDPSNAVYGYRLAWNHIMDVKLGVTMPNGAKTTKFVSIREWINGEWGDIMYAPIERIKNRTAFMWGGEIMMLKDRRWVRLDNNK